MRQSAAAAKAPGTEILDPNAWSGDGGLTLVEFAPYGVIGSIIPSTNPTSTVMYKTLVAVKARNGIVHRMAVGHGDIPHRSPPGVGRDRVGFNGKAGNELEEVVVFDLASDKGDIVSEGTDFCSKFVYKTYGYGCIWPLVIPFAD